MKKIRIDQIDSGSLWPSASLAVSASYAETASYALNAGGSLDLTDNYVPIRSSNTLVDSIISQSGTTGVEISGSVTASNAQINGVMEQGLGVSASGYSSHAEGRDTTANGDYSHAEGYYANANGLYSHAEGVYTTTNGAYSHAEGYYTSASGYGQHVAGRYNISQGNPSSFVNTDYAYIIGNGTSNVLRANALTLDWLGNLTLSGSVTASAFSGDLAGTASYAVTASYAENAGDTEIYNENSQLMSGNYTYSGLVTSNLPTAIAVNFGDVVFVSASGELAKANASSSATSFVFGMVVVSALLGNTPTILRSGYVRNDDWNFTIGGALYLSASAGSISQTKPAEEGQWINALGISYDTGRIQFNPGNVLSEVNLDTYFIVK